MAEKSMYLYNDKWEVEIDEINYNPKSADNCVCPNAYIVICDDYFKTICVSVADAAHTIEKKIVLKVSFFTPHDDYAFIEDNSLYLFLNDTVCVFDVQTGEIKNKKSIGMMGTLFSVYRYQRDFILYCEMDIIRMTPNLDVAWDFGARDIFVRYHGEEPAFEMMPDRIRLYDFSDNYYEIDYDGCVIRD